MVFKAEWAMTKGQLQGFLLREKFTILSPHYNCAVLLSQVMNSPYQLTPKLLSMTCSAWLCPGSCHVCSYHPTVLSVPLLMPVHLSTFPFLCSAHNWLPVDTNSFYRLISNITIFFQSFPHAPHTQRKIHTTFSFGTYSLTPVTLHCT